VPAVLDRWRARADGNRSAGNARFLTVASLRWVLRNRAYTPWYLLRYWRFLRFKLTNPQVVTTGFVFLGRRVEVQARPGFGRLVLGRWVHLGDGTSLRCHEGSLRIGDKTVFGRNIVVNTYLDVRIGGSCIIADLVYVTDFDHVFADVTVPIKDQGIAKSPVRIGSDVWLGTKVSIVRGTVIGDGVVVAANAVVTRDLPDFAVAAGVPARVIRNRQDAAEAGAQTRAALADMAVKLAAAGRAAAAGQAVAAGTPPAGQLNHSIARCRAVAAIVAAATGSRSRPATASASAPGFWLANRLPVTPGSTSSRRPPVSATATGVPASCASSATRPNGSYTDGTTTTSAAPSRPASSAWSRKPGQLISSATR
jgi:acetyltransferase-like isoleucine patch superfamily enzyme